MIRNVAHRRYLVVPRAGTWIETIVGNYMTFEEWVVPRAGTWIETQLFQRGYLRS